MTPRTQSRSAPRPHGLRSPAIEPPRSPLSRIRDSPGSRPAGGARQPWLAPLPDGVGGILCRPDGGRPGRHDHLDLQRNQLGDESRKPAGLVFRGTVLDRQSLALDMPKIAQTLAKRVPATHPGRRSKIEDTNRWLPRLLCPGGQRRGKRTNQRGQHTLTLVLGVSADLAQAPSWIDKGHVADRYVTVHRLDLEVRVMRRRDGVHV